MKNVQLARKRVLERRVSSFKSISRLAAERDKEVVTVKVISANEDKLFTIHKLYTKTIRIMSPFESSWAMIVILHCQLDWIWDYPRDKPLDNYFPSFSH